MVKLWQQLQTLLASGGAVMIPLLFVGFLVNFLLALRAFSLLGLGAGLARDARLPKLSTLRKDLVVWLKQTGGQWQRSRWISMESLLLQRLAGLRRKPAVINALITAAPLLGLLGTVSGMIVTFEALADMSMFRQSGGIAGGISEALLTTQVGLGIAIPALLLQRLLDRWALRWQQRLELALAYCRKRNRELVL